MFTTFPVKQYYFTYKKNKIMAETTTQNVNNMASYADAANEQHTIFRDCSDQLSGVKPIFILESDKS